MHYYKRHIVDIFRTDCTLIELGEHHLPLIHKRIAHARAHQESLGI